MKTMLIGSKDWGKKNDPGMMAEALGADLYFWEDLVLDISRNEVKIFCQGVDLLAQGYQLAICLGWYKNGEKGIYRDLALAVAKIFDQAGIEYWNSEMGQQRSTSKLSQMVIMALNGIYVPHTRFALDAQKLTDALPEQKYVIKAAAASRGANNFCAQNLTEAKEILASHQGSYLVQDFIPNDHDLRIICFGGEAKLALKRSRQSADTHLNNTSQGGKAEWIELNDEIRAEAAKITKLLGREMGGVDFIEVEDLDKSGKIYYYCLEINAIPQLTSGTDADYKMQVLSASLNEK